MAHCYFMVSNDMSKRFTGGGCLKILLVGVGGEEDEKFMVWRQKSMGSEKKTAAKVIKEYFAASLTNFFQLPLPLKT